MLYRRNLLILSLCFCFTGAGAQYFKKSRYKYEIVGGLGVTNFLGDLGGANSIGTHFLRDYDFPSLRPIIHAGFRYKDSRYWAVKGSLNFGWISGNDRLTSEIYRQNRNLSFRSPIGEISVQAEGYFTGEKQGHLYKIKNVKGWKNLEISGYGFAGLGVTFFNPRGKYQGKWYSLQKLGTEGQGIGGPKKYHRATMVFPVGIGGKYAINKQWSVGLEFGVRYTLTDYMDDVSGVYFDNDSIRAVRGDVAAHFADPSLGIIGPFDGISVTGTGQQRGNPKDDDAYLFTFVTVGYKFFVQRKTRSKF